MRHDFFPRNEELRYLKIISSCKKFQHSKMKKEEIKKDKYNRWKGEIQMSEKIYAQFEMDSRLISPIESRNEIDTQALNTLVVIR